MVVVVDTITSCFSSLCFVMKSNFSAGYFGTFSPRAGSGVVRMDPLRFLAGCRTRRLNQA